MCSDEIQNKMNKLQNSMYVIVRWRACAMRSANFIQTLTPSGAKLKTDFCCAVLMLADINIYC